MDPNQVVGKPTEREVWLAPDWSTYEPITKRQPSGYTRVSVRETTYADGRVVTHVLDASRQPITHQILDQTMDDDQARRWKDQQTAANRPPEERNNNGRRERWNPQTKEWENVGPAINTTAPSSEPKGPPGGKGYIDEETPNGNRLGWNPATQAYDIILGPSAARPRSGPSTEQAAVPGYPGWTQTTQVDASGNKLTVYTDPQGQTHRSLPAKPDEGRAPSVQTINGGDGQPYTRVVTMGPNGQPTVKTYGPNGQEVASIPGERSKPDIRQATGADGQVYTTVTTIGPDNRPTVQTFNPRGEVVPSVPQKPEEKYKEVRQGKDGRWYGFTRDGKWEEVQGGPDAPGPAGANQGPALPQLVLGQSTEALRTYREQLLQQVTAGTITPIVAQQRWKEASDLAGFYIQESQLVNSEEQSRRSADVSLRTNAMSNATSGFNSALSFIQHINDRLQPGSSAGARAFRAILGMQQLHAREMGAFRNEFSDPSVPRTRGGAGTMAPPSSADRRPPMMAPESAPAAPAPPNAIGAGAVPESITPTPAAPTNTTDAGGVPREYTPASSTVGSGIPPAPPEGGPPISMSEPTEEFAALNSYMPAPMPVAQSEVAVPQPESMVQAPPMQEMSPAMLLAEIRSTPPWRLDEQTVQQARTLGIPEEEIFGVPGRMVA